MIAFSPVRQSPQILELFLRSARGLDLWVYDDNTDPESSAMLREADCLILDPIDLPPSNYERGDTHRWDGSTVRRVAAIKNHAIGLFFTTGDDHLFLVDSDVLTPPGLVDHLEGSDLPIVSAIYWTRWVPDSPPMPNVFPIDSPTLSRLRSPGHHEVGGLGACTLIHRDVFSHARFDEVKHLATEGEDRWFCWRCHQAGVSLTACTHMDLFHVYRDSEIAAGGEWLDEAHRPAELV